MQYGLKKIICLISFTFTFTFTFSQSKDSLIISKIYTEALSNGRAYTWLEYLSEKIGGRLSGSPEAAKAVKWGKSEMEELNVDKVFLQECMVPHWMRGEKESAVILSSKTKNMISVPVCALGGSIATPSEGITANVVEIKNWVDLEKFGKKNIEGKIVFYNRPLNPAFINTFQAYGNAVDQRWAGAMRAAPYGAVGVVVRSMTTLLDDYPHTGSMGYADTVPKIPACAISTLGAEKLSEQLQHDPETKFRFTQSCKTLPDEKSYNVIGEIKGSEHPEEIILVGGHLDSWETGHGAHDDGAGVVQAMEVLNVFKKLGIQPKRTIRAVLFMNEENGGRGGKKYAELAKQNNEKNIAAIESDAGGHTPYGFGVEGKKEEEEKVRSWRELFKPYHVYDFDGDGSGSDVDHLKDQGTLLIGLHPDSQRYFDYHHSAKDVFSNVNKRELELGAAACAALVYLLSEYGVGQ